MTQTERYTYAKEAYTEFGVDTDAAIAVLKEIPVSLHCWQGDDVTGFDHEGPLTGGIQTTGNYPGKAGTPEELMADIDMVLKCTPGRKKLNLHASYAIFEEGESADRDKLEPEHFAKWTEFARERNLGIDFNPTFFSHDKIKDGLTLSSPDEETRRFWVEHGKACIRISEYFAKETGMPCVMNIHCLLPHLTKAVCRLWITDIIIRQRPFRTRYRHCWHFSRKLPCTSRVR